MSHLICPFCNPEIERIAFCSSEHFLTIYNISPILPGHSMVIPKNHMTNFLSLSSEFRSEMIELGVKSVRLLQKAFHCNDFDLTLQSGYSAGQSIEHLHLHLIPRKENDLPNPGDWYPHLVKSYENLHIENPEVPKYSFDQLEMIAKKIRSLK